MTPKKTNPRKAGRKPRRIRVVTVNVTIQEDWWKPIVQATGADDPLMSDAARIRKMVLIGLKSLGLVDHGKMGK